MDDLSSPPYKVILASSYSNTMASALGEIETVLLVERDKVFQKSDAIFRIVSALGGVWKIFSLFTFLPKALRNYGYTVIARNRYSWFGQSDTCMVPQDDLIDRFIK